MTTTLRVDAIARQLVDDLENLFDIVPLKPAQYDQAVQLVREAFAAAHSNQLESDSKFTCCHGKTVYGSLKLTQIFKTDCAKCSSTTG